MESPSVFNSLTGYRGQASRSFTNSGYRVPVSTYMGQVTSGSSSYSHTPLLDRASCHTDHHHVVLVHGLGVEAVRALTACHHRFSYDVLQAPPEALRRYAHGLPIAFHTGSQAVSTRKRGPHLPWFWWWLAGLLLSVSSACGTSLTTSCLPACLRVPLPLAAAAQADPMGVGIWNRPEAAARPPNGRLEEPQPGQASSLKTTTAEEEVRGQAGAPRVPHLSVSWQPGLPVPLWLGADVGCSWWLVAGRLPARRLLPPRQCPSSTRPYRRPPP